MNSKEIIEDKKSLDDKLSLELESLSFADASTSLSESSPVQILDLTIATNTDEEVDDQLVE